MVKTNFLFLSFVLLFFGINPAMSQYAPQAGNAGTTAIHKDSVLISTFSNYSATMGGHQLKRGWVNKADTGLGKASVGALDTFLNVSPGQHIISLGDGGELTLKMQLPIINKSGPDFVVFDNGFPFAKDSFFLELAFVEVSADGKKFFRFPAHSLTDTLNQVGPFGSIKANLINNLAGKYVMPYGVPFDLEELKDSLQGKPIQYLKFVDVVGSINPMLGERDSKGNVVNDPWPTPFPSSGFDLLMVGFIHVASGMGDNLMSQELVIFPNPVKYGQQMVLNNSNEIHQISLLDIAGRIRFNQQFEAPNQNHSFNIDLLPGIYFLHLEDNWGRISTRKIWVQP